jgi:steroid delta-isomerase-like uncharacterized protein
MPDSPETVVRAWFDEVWNQGREDTIDRLFARDGVAHGLSGSDGASMRGPEAFKPFFRKFRGAFPDIRVEVVRTVSEGDMVTAHCHVTGSHRGDALGQSATGKPIDIWGTSIAQVRDGQIIEAWNHFDFLTLYQQLGWLPSLPA